MGNLLTYLRFLVIPLMLCAFQSKAQYQQSFSDRIFFDTSDYHLDDRDYPVLNQAVALIKKQPGVLLLLTGHTDTTGSAKFNYHLSQLRLEEVKKYFLQKGVSEKNLLLVGKGESEPYYFHGMYNDKYCRRVELQQVVRVHGKILNNITLKPVPSVELRVENTSPKGLEIKVESNGNYEVLMPFRKFMILLSAKEGFLTSVDTFRFSSLAIATSDINHDIKLKPAIIKNRLTFQNIYFSSGSAQILPESESSIAEIYQLLFDNPNIFIEIQGHVHQPDREKLSKNILEDGKVLSANRAKSVYKELIKRGINPSRMSYRGMGSEQMKYQNPQNTTEEQLNRRVEVLILEME